MNQTYVLAGAVAILTLAAANARGAEIGHYAPGVVGIRDFVVPEPGLYGAIYNYYYTTDRLNGANGDEIESVTVGPPPGVTLDLDVDVDVYAIAPTLIWVSDRKLLGAKVAAYIAPSFSNTSLGASLSTATGSARSADDSNFDLADLYVQLDLAGLDEGALGIRHRLRLLCARR